MIAHLLLTLIRLYQRTLSPLLGPVCRFTPSCSQYMAICIERFGPARGVWLGTCRLAHCHPFHPGGVDLPPAGESTDASSDRTHSHFSPRAPRRGKSRTLEQRP